MGIELHIPLLFLCLGSVKMSPLLFLLLINCVFSPFSPLLTWSEVYQFYQFTNVLILWLLSKNHLLVSVFTCFFRYLDRVLPLTLVFWYSNKKCWFLVHSAVFLLLCLVNFQFFNVLDLKLEIYLLIWILYIYIYVLKYFYALLQRLFVTLCSPLEF